MATDNTRLNPGSGGDTIRTLDRTGTGAPKTEVVQLDLGGPDPNAEFLVAAGSAVSARSLPVVIASDQAAVPITTSGALQIKPDGTIWTLTGTSANVNVTNFPATQPVSGTVTANQGGAPWSDNLTQVAGVALGATGVVNYGSTPAAVAVPGVNAFVTNTVTITPSGTITISGTVNVSGIIADATAFTRGTTLELPVGGVVEALQSGLTTGQSRALSLTTAAALRVDGSAVTQPVSGPIAVTQATATNLNAAIAGATGGVSQPITTASGVNTTAQLNSGVIGSPTVSFSVSSASMVTGGLIVFEGSTDGGTSWAPIAAYPLAGGPPVTSFVPNSGNAIYIAPVIGCGSVRMRLAVQITGGSCSMNTNVCAIACGLPGVTARLQAGRTDLDIGNGPSTAGTIRVRPASDDDSIALLNQILSVLRAMHLQDGANYGTTVDPFDVMSDTLN